jgi:CBS domain containing-hemolysin-like protein
VAAMAMAMILACCQSELMVNPRFIFTWRNLSQLENNKFIKTKKINLIYSKLYPWKGRDLFQNFLINKLWHNILKTAKTHVFSNFKLMTGILSLTWGILFCLEMIPGEYELGT